MGLGLEIKGPLKITGKDLRRWLLCKVLKPLAMWEFPGSCSWGET